MRTILADATLIDCVHPTPAPHATVVVEDGRISEILTDGRRPPPGHATVLDLAGAYLLPGLWDVHVHPDYLSLADVPLADQVTRFGHRLTTALAEAGVTAVRCAGTHSFMDVAWKRAFDAGQFVGPRVYACGHFLTTTAGHFLASGHALECDGPYGFVKAIREQIKHGVDHIKLDLSGGIMGPPWDGHGHAFLLEEELEAAFAVCRQRAFKVMAHATSPDTVKRAIRHGAHSVEHGYLMDDECVALFLEHGTWYVPTLAVSHLTPGQVEAGSEWERRWVEQRHLEPALCARADAAAEGHRAWFRKALDAGVKMALGSDIRPLEEAALLEMGLWVKDGATPWQTLLAATKHAADLCGAGADLGTVEVGKLADLIVVAANPLEDVANVRRLLLVLKEGRVVSDRRGRQ
jgi:imidazolonepropionase-like amidohydrolase